MHILIMYEMSDLCFDEFLANIHVQNEVVDCADRRMVGTYIDA